MQDLVEASRKLGLQYHESDGRKKTKEDFKKAINSQLKAPRGTGIRKRTFIELEQAVKNAGGQYQYPSTTIDGRRVRRRMTRSAMEAFLV